MSDGFDLRDALNSWPYDPDNDARFTRGMDGREVLQVRTPLGIEQYEIDGRPDGTRPHGLESLLEFHLRKLARAKADKRETEFELSPQECGELFNEGTLYYFRYVRLFQLKDWVRTLRDTSRNLQVFDLVHRYAHREEDQQFLEKWRPYIIRVNSTAAVMIELEKQAYDRALNLVNEALERLEKLEDLDDETFKFEQERSVLALKELAAQILKNRPMSELEQLEHQLRRAVERQEFERAAQLRDRIRALKKQQIC
ncbi:MAG TPA: UvrB/UvrC motif-containing protein [Candidatus Limnocylindrales bacterium]|nr:UvrB/UvrC motif-containing protein [Candidatus Limnocylindrales bacterium]